MSGVKIDDMDFKWGKQRGRGGKKNDVQFYESFTYDGVEYYLYDSVYLFKDGEVEPYIGKLIKIWEAANKMKRVKVLWFFRPSDISSYLSNESTKENELFLATGNGTGLTNVNLLEVISGKCTVVCTSKDERNRQPSTEEYENAEYIFYRTFDVDKCTISDKLGEKIAGIEVRFLLNTKDPEKSTNSKLDCRGEKDGACVDKLPISREMGLVDEGILKRGPNVKSSLDTSDDIVGSDGCEKASSRAEVNKLSCQNRSETLSLKRDSSGEVQRCTRDDGELRNDSCQVFRLDNGIKSSYDKSICDGDNVANIKPQQETTKGFGLPAKDGLNLSNERPSKKLKPNSAKQPPNVSCKSSGPSVLGSPGTKDVKTSLSTANAVGSTNDVKPSFGSAKDVKPSLGSTKDVKSSLGSSKDVKTSSHATIATGGTKDVKMSSHIGIAAGSTKDVKTTLPVGGVAGITKDVKTPLLPTTATGSTKDVKTSSSVANPIGNRDKMSRDSLVAKNGSQELTPRMKVAKNCNEKLHRTPTNKETQAYGQVMEVTRRPNSEKSKWFSGEAFWEDKMNTAAKDRRLVLLQNLDPAYTSSEVEDIIFHGFRETCTAKMVQCTAISSPLSGQSIVVFKTREAAEKIVTKLKQECLLLANKRPLVAKHWVPSLPGKQSAFPGHLLIDKINFQSQKEKREAVSTSHSSQPNNLEYDLAMEWRLLQDRYDWCWGMLYQQQEKELKDVKARFKSK